MCGYWRMRDGCPRLPSSRFKVCQQTGIFQMYLCSGIPWERGNVCQIKMSRAQKNAAVRGRFLYSYLLHVRFKQFLSLYFYHKKLLNIYRESTWLISLYILCKVPITILTLEFPKFDPSLSPVLNFLIIDQKFQNHELFDIP